MILQGAQIENIGGGGWTRTDDLGIMSFKTGVDSK
jgi:hypothetical protein